MESNNAKKIEEAIQAEYKDHSIYRLSVKSWAMRNCLMGLASLMQELEKHLIKGEPFRLVIEHKGETDKKEADHIYYFDIEKEDQSL